MKGNSGEPFVWLNIKNWENEKKILENGVVINSKKSKKQKSVIEELGQLDPLFEEYYKEYGFYPESKKIENIMENDAVIFEAMEARTYEYSSFKESIIGIPFCVSSLLKLKLLCIPLAFRPLFWLMSSLCFLPIMSLVSAVLEHESFFVHEVAISNDADRVLSGEVVTFKKLGNL